MSLDWKFIDNDIGIPWTNKRTTSVKEQRIDSCDSGYGSVTISPEELSIPAEEFDLMADLRTGQSSAFPSNPPFDQNHDFSFYDDLNTLVPINTSKVSHIRTEITTVLQSMLTRFVVAKHIRKNRVP